VPAQVAEAALAAAGAGAVPATRTMLDEVARARHGREDEDTREEKSLVRNMKRNSMFHNKQQVGNVLP
jgi:hypothetical protein